MPRRWRGFKAALIGSLGGRPLERGPVLAIAGDRFELKRNGRILREFQDLRLEITCHFKPHRLGPQLDCPVFTSDKTTKGFRFPF